MSLGIKSLWRAQGCITRINGLSLIPREQRNPLYQELSLPRWISTGRRVTKMDLLRKIATDGSLKKRKSKSHFIRVMRKQVIKTSSRLPPKATELVKQAVRYPTKEETRRSLRKSRRSAARQHIYDSEHEASSERFFSGWQSTFDLMFRNTVDISEILYFQIIIGRGVAAEARAILSEPDTHISQIGRRNESIVRIEETNLGNGELVLSLSGSEDSVRKTLLDIVGVVGKITAVRVSDPNIETLLSSLWKGTTGKRPEILLFGDGEVAVDDKTLTVQPFSNSTNYKTYRLKRRANNVNRPAKWTQDSFEKYVASLVYARVPPHRARVLYPNFPDHQETVVSLLTALFTAEHTRQAASLSALKMAIEFIESRGGGFRQASRTIFNQAELLGLPMDTEIFNIFLISASKAGDLAGFHSIVRAMLRKGYTPQGRSWIAFLEMIQSPAIKRYIVTMLKHKGLNHNSSTLCAIGRQMAIIDLGRKISADFDMQTFIDKQDKKYGPRWLDTISVNRLMDVLGAHKNWDACNVLLDHIYATGITSPNAVTLNTILIHMTNFALRIPLMKSIFTRWPKLVPNPDTYHILFRAAWTRNYPNTLRVVFRHAALARRTTPKMRYVLTGLLMQDINPSGRRALLKTWEDVIFGQAELAEARAAHLDNLEAVHLIHIYVREAQGMTFKDAFIENLSEALEMDETIHQLLRNGLIVKPSAEVRESLTVPLPLIKYSTKAQAKSRGARQKQVDSSQGG
ncbi:hypothetical protein K445DRAFT_321107 [Daldinia sp. EC12]|nr:hypothetical protein K445DRAFT_321107 [Daldinia sp. EC12]